MDYDFLEGFGVILRLGDNEIASSLTLKISFRDSQIIFLFL